MASEALRPEEWGEFIGQAKLKGRLRIHIRAALERGDMLEHLLLLGPAGVGKTSLARLVTQELGVQMHSFVMPIRIKNLRRAILEAGEKEAGTAFFLDEIHRMKVKEQEWLLPVLEDRYIQDEEGKKIFLQGQFTFIGATTEQRKVIVPLQDRFAIKPAFEEYSPAEMAEIVRRMAHRVGLKPSEEECFVLGAASCGIPRQARTLIYTARDLGTTSPEPVLTVSGITPEGLTEAHVAYLCTIDSLGMVAGVDLLCNQLRLPKELGMVAGVDLLCNQLRLPKELVLDLERVLVNKQFIQYTAKGRELTVEGHKIVKREEAKVK